MTLHTMLTTTALALACHVSAAAQSRPAASGPVESRVGITITRGTTAADSSLTVTIGKGVAREGHALTEGHYVRRGMLYGGVIGAVSGALIGVLTADPNPRVMFSDPGSAAIAGALFGAIGGMVVGGIVGAFIQ